MDIELRHIRYFLAVAQTRHMSRAAEQLGIQQPPLSVQIRSLEAQLGIQLFHRQPRGMALTEGGKVFQAEARKLIDDFAAMTSRMAKTARGEKGTVRLGYTSSAAAHPFVPAALRSLRQRYPDIELELSEDNAADLTDALVDGRLNCALLRVPVAQPEGIAFETLLREPALVALPVDHCLAQKRSSESPPLHLKELKNEAFILVRRAGAPGLYSNLVSLCERYGFTPKILAEVPRMMTNLNLVAAGAGISVVPASMQNTHSEAIRYIPMAASHKLDAPLTMAWRKDELAGPARSLVELLRTNASHWPMPASARTPPHQSA